VLLVAHVLSLILHSQHPLSISQGEPSLQPSQLFLQQQQLLVSLFQQLSVSLWQRLSLLLLTVVLFFAG
jgi:hypothetical protein